MNRAQERFVHNLGVCACQPSNPLRSTPVCSMLHGSTQHRDHSETVLLEFFVELGHRLVSESSSACLDLLLLLFVERSRLLLSLILELGHDVLLGPSGELGEVSHGAEVSVGFHSEDFEGLRDNHSLLLVIGEWDSFENFQSRHGSGTSGGLVRGHASDHLPQDARW